MQEKRDLRADLQMCEDVEKENLGIWFIMHDVDVCREWPPGSGEVDGVAYALDPKVAEYIVQSRIGWKEAIRRAIEAEAKLESIKNII